MQRPILRDTCHTQAIEPNPVHPRKWTEVIWGRNKTSEERLDQSSGRLERGGEVIWGSSLQILEDFHLKDKGGPMRVMDVFCWEGADP